MEIECDYHSSHKNKLNLEDRIASLYSRYQTQYSAMESTIAGLNETSSLLENAFKETAIKN